MSSRPSPPPRPFLDRIVLIFSSFFWWVSAPSTARAIVMLPHTPGGTGDGRHIATPSSCGGCRGSAFRSFVICDASSKRVSSVSRSIAGLAAFCREYPPTLIPSATHPPTHPPRSPPSTTLNSIRHSRSTRRGDRGRPPEEFSRRHEHPSVAFLVVGQRVFDDNCAGGRFRDVRGNGPTSQQRPAWRSATPASTCGVLRTITFLQGNSAPGEEV